MMFDQSLVIGECGPLQISEVYEETKVHSYVPTYSIRIAFVQIEIAQHFTTLRKVLNPIEYRPSSDCRHFFSCFNFNEPYKIACPIGYVYDAVDYTCKPPKVVSECSCWYDCAAKANSSCPSGPCNADCSCPSGGGDGKDDDYENLDARADSVQG